MDEIDMETKFNWYEKLFFGFALIAGILITLGVIIIIWLIIIEQIMG